MDGSNRQVLVSQDVVWPNGLTLGLLSAISMNLLSKFCLLLSFWKTNLFPSELFISANDFNIPICKPMCILYPPGSDLITHKMYWTEASLDYIGMANMDGSDPQKIVITNVLQPFSITLSC